MLWNLPGPYSGFNNLTGISTQFYNDASGQPAAFDKYFGDNGLRGPALDWARRNEDQFTNAYLNWYNSLPIKPVTDPNAATGAGNAPPPPSATGGTDSNPNVDPATGQPYQSTPGSYFTAWLSQYGGPLLAQYNYLPARQRGVNTAAFQPSRLMF